MSDFTIFNFTMKKILSMFFLKVKIFQTNIRFYKFLTVYLVQSSENCTIYENITGATKNAK